MKRSLLYEKYEKGWVIVLPKELPIPIQIQKTPSLGAYLREGGCVNALFQPKQANEPSGGQTPPWGSADWHEHLLLNTQQTKKPGYRLPLSLLDRRFCSPARSDFSLRAASSTRRTAS